MFTKYKRAELGVKLNFIFCKASIFVAWYVVSGFEIQFEIQNLKFRTF